MSSTVMSEASNGACPDLALSIGGSACLMPAKVNAETFSSVSCLPRPGRVRWASLAGVDAPEESGVIAAGAIVVCFSYFDLWSMLYLEMRYDIVRISMTLNARC